jgi:UDP-N-acetylmuramate dehydrogenase
MDILKNQSLLHYNSFGINAQTAYFANVQTIDDIKEGLEFARDKRLLILGGGSNLLILKDWDGLAMHIDLQGIEKLGEDNQYYYVRAAAGQNWHQFVRYCISQNLAGIENLSLIPGSVGAGPMQNIGAYGVEIKDVFYELEAMDRENYSIRKFSKDECQFDYRSSIFKTHAKDQYIILNVTFKFLRNPLINTSYGAIEERLAQMGVKNPRIKDISDAVIYIRESKLPDPSKIGNAGSFFKNPVVSFAQYEQLKYKYPSVSAYPQSNGTVKIAAGWLIEQSGWKGKRFDNYGVHVNQALVLVNYGGAKGQEIYDLSENIVQDIKAKFGIELEREVNMIK